MARISHVLRSTKALGSVLAVIAALLVVLLDAHPAHAVTLTVNSRADPGTGGCNSTQCTLREAINTSNGLPTTETIEFAIPDNPTVPGIEVKTISPNSALPTITDNVTIDGYTQAGALPNSATTNANNAVLKVELSGANAPSAADGLVVSGAEAGNTTIRGLAINRFGDDGLSINAPAAKVVGNVIGTNAAGDADLGNGGNGVRLLSAQNVVGRRDDADQNVISGNGGHGVSVEAPDNIIANNHIGTDADAEEDLGNSLSGVFVDNAPDVLVGGSSLDGSLNIISGNDRHGVEVSNIGAEGARIVGNLIGLDRNGNGFSDVGNSRDGVRVSSTPRVEIGDTVAGGGNAISDNGEHGVEIVGTSSTTNVVLGNRIGTNFNGSSDFGNLGDGVRIGNSSSSTIGGTVAGAGNVISGNDANGVFISGTSSATSNKVQGNAIGVDANGASGIGNSEVGVRVETPGNLIGGTAAGSRNIISDNGGVGVSMLGSGADGNTVQGNLIGRNVNSPANNLGNFHGVFVSDAADNMIGGTTAAAANTISGNRNQGVMVIGAAAARNSILRNSIFNNGTPGGLGIELNNDGVTPNDPQDPDTGPNALQNFPVLTAANTIGVEGRLNSRPRRDFTIQFYSNPAPNIPTGFGEGQTFIGEINVRTNLNGRVTFTFPSALTSGEFVTATATIDSGNTSEFSAARLVE
jgi:CSLREA domain-containing protein